VIILVELKEVHKNIIFTVVISFVIFILGVFINFIIVRFIPGDPARQYLASMGILSPTQEQYLDALRTLGFDQPIIIQFFRYLGNLFTANWGISIAINAGMPVTEILRIAVPRTIEIIYIPLIIGLVVGIILGRLSRKYEDHKIGKYINVYVAVAIAVPTFVFAMIFQLVFGYLLNVLPAFGYKTISYADPSLITGFLIVDSLIDGNIALAGDILLHFILPELCLTLIVTALVTRQYRSTIESNAITTTRSLISNTATIGYHFGFIFTSIILVETTFNVGGFGSYFLNAIMVGDFFVIVAFVNMIIIFFAITSIISNIIFSVRESEQFISPGSFDETYPHLKWKSPFTIIGLIIISFFIIVALYPEIISQYSLTELKSSFPGQWELPSSDHLLGQGTSGRDMLGQIVWGVSFCILVGMGAVVIGILGGLLFGLTATKLSERGKNLVTGFTLVIYIIPSAILVFLIALIFGSNFIMTMIFIGIVLIPSFTRITANASTLEINVFKSILKYLPLMVGIAMILFESINFLGFSDTRIITLGQLINEGRLQLYYYFGFAIFPAIAIILMVTGLILLYEGL